MFISCFFFFNDTATTEIYTSSHTLSLHDALPICPDTGSGKSRPDTKELPGNGRSEEHTSELQSRELISYAVFCLKKKKPRRHSHAAHGARRIFADQSTYPVL